jgi:hypothetical protein
VASKEQTFSMPKVSLNFQKKKALQSILSTKTPRVDTRAHETRLTTLLDTVISMASFFALVAQQTEFDVVANIFFELERVTSQQLFKQCIRQVEEAFPILKRYNFDLDNSSSPNLHLPRCKDLIADFSILVSLKNELAPEKTRNYPQIDQFKKLDKKSARNNYVGLIAAKSNKLRYKYTSLCDLLTRSYL